jgi:hypothetical protein
MNRAVLDLRQAGATPEQLDLVPVAWTLLFTGANGRPTCTPAAIAKWWPQLRAAMDRGYVARGPGQVETDDLRAAIAGAEAEALEEVAL